MRSVFVSQSTDPTYNLSAEELLVMNCKPEDEILYLWQNEKTVVIGRNQNPWKECAVEALRQSGGKLIRRRSGGGAVYHDLGNLNYTFISRATGSRQEKNLGVVLETLALQGVDAYFSGKNDILVGGKKVSGCAYYEEDGILCHHGTLLVRSDLNVLESVLQPSILKLKSKGIDSIRSRVSNLSEISEAITVPKLIADLCRVYTGSERFDPIQKVWPLDSSEIGSLMGHYNSWDWCFGETPAFSFQTAYRYSWGEVELYLDVADGRIQRSKVFSDALDPELPQRLEEHLAGKGIEDLEHTIGQLSLSHRLV